jgi:HlyD family secretion protein
VRRGLILATLAALVVGLRLFVFAPAPVDVSVIRVSKGRVEETVVNSKAGTIRSRRRAALSPEVGGRVMAVAVREGQRVTRGQVLLRLADADAQAQLAVQASGVDAARSTVREACAMADLAERELARAHKLAELGALALEELDRAIGQRDTTRSACAAATARARQAESALALARVTRAKSELRAPFDAIVAEIATEEGEWITPSPPGLFVPPVIELIDERAIYVSAPLDEADVAAVRPALPVRVTMDAYPGRSFAAHVTRVAPYVVDRQDQNRTFEVEIDFDDPEFARTLLPGASADVAVIVKTRDGVLRVPADALRQDSSVLTVRDGVLVAVQVVVGLRNWEYAEILSGLALEDPVVVSLDRPEIRAGAKARIQNEVER